MREFAVAEVDESLALAQLFDDETESGEAGVDSAAFSEAIASCVSLRRLFRSSKID